MNILPKLRIDIKKGKIIPMDENKFHFYLQSLEGKKETSKHLNGFILSIKPARGVRTIEHNEFYWAVVNPVLAEALGSTSRMEAHEELIWLRYPNGEEKTRKNFRGGIIKYSERKKSSEMNVKEFTEFVEWCKDFGALEFDIDWEQYIDSEEDNK